MTIGTIVVGTGFWARTALMPALLAQQEIRVRAVVDPNTQGATEAARLAGEATTHRTFAEALDRHGTFDLVVVTTPDDLHPPMVTAALESGSAVFCEKPLANDAATASRLADLAERSPRPATVGYSFRYNPAIQALKHDLEGGKLGTPWLIELAEHNPQFHPHGGKPLNWKGDPAAARAGALFEYGSHVVDLAMWLAGPIERVSTSLTRVLPGARLDDVATLQLGFKEPTIGVLVASWVLAGGFPGIRIRVHGSRAVGEVRLDHRLPGGQSYRRGDPLAEDLDDVSIEKLIDPRNDATRRHVADLVRLIEGRTPIHGGTFPSLHDGARTQDVLEAALAAQSRWMPVEYLHVGEAGTS